MPKNFASVENSVDNEIKRKRQADFLAQTIKMLTKNVKSNGLTEEQEFLIKYYDLDKEDVIREKIDVSNVEKILHYIPEEKREEIETDRYKVLIYLFATFQNFDEQEVNRYNDMFHKDITDWDDYVEGFEHDPLLVKKMRNLQMLNRMAHEYETVFKTIFYAKNPQMNELSEHNKRKVENYISNLFVGTQEDKRKANEELTKMVGTREVGRWKNDEAMKYCIIARKWMFNQKNNKYLVEVLEGLKDAGEQYKYGIYKNSIIFDVPGYGQFSIHLGEKNEEKISDIRKLGVKDYDGIYLGNTYILSKADPELLKEVNYDELSEMDKQAYDIAIRGIQEEREEQKEKQKNEEENLQIAVKDAKSPEKAQEIVDIIKEAGLPEDIINKEILNKGKPKVIRDIIEIIKNNEYGIELGILTRCKTLLTVGEYKAIDIMEILEKIDKLGLNVKDIITKNPTILTVSKSDKLEPIYDTLKQYKIDLTTNNIANAFMGTAENIRRNMDLVIENGLYEFAKTGVTKFFTTNNKNLNMKMNLLKENNEQLILEEENKRKINANLFLKEKDLMDKYGISKKEILEELSKIRGQELINESKYYVEEENPQKTLSKEQQEISSTIYEKLKDSEQEDNIVLKLGDYYYSAIKVKEQIDNIVANKNIKNLENEDINEIIKIALLQNKNITLKEVEEISAQIQELGVKDTKQEQLDEEMPVQEETEQEEGKQEKSEQEELEKNQQVEENGQKEEQEEQEEKDEKQDEENAETLEDTKYDRIRQMTEDIKEKEQNIETMKEIIKHLKEVRKTLKTKIREMEEKIDQSILNSEEPKSEVIQDIKKLRQIVEKQKEKRKQVKQMIKTYKKDKKIAKYTLQREKEARDNAIDEIEL